MRITGALGLDTRPQRRRGARRGGKSGIIAVLVDEGMGEREIDADKKRCLVRRGGKREKLSSTASRPQWRCPCGSSVSGAPPPGAAIASWIPGWRGPRAPDQSMPMKPRNTA